MTEDEAKTKWCPFGHRAAGNVPSSANRDQLDGPVTFCIASECMAWRWAIDEMRERHPKSPTSAVVEEYRHREGYCGLAGRP